jgi:hypothetical protein
MASNDNLYMVSDETITISFWTMLIRIALGV